MQRVVPQASAIWQRPTYKGSLVKSCEALQIFGIAISNFWAIVFTFFVLFVDAHVLEVA